MFEIETQKQDQWCWAAVTVSVARYFDATCTLQQCDIAHGLVGQDCCSAPALCNSAKPLQDALGLEEVGSLRDIQPALTFDQVADELRQGFPIAVRIEWFGGGGHFLVIRGCRQGPGMQLLNIADPWYVDSIQDFDTFTSNYLGLGEWTNSFRLKKR